MKIDLRWMLLILTLLIAAVASFVMPVSDLMVLAKQDTGLAKQILWELRLPRTLLALGYGAALGISGAALQAVFANPLAAPDLTGSSSGAALGAVLGAYWFGISSPIGLAAVAASGAAIALILLLLLAGRRAAPTTLLLAGLAVSLAAGALTTLALSLAPSPFAFYDSFEWLMGSFVDRSRTQAAVALVPAGIACLLLLGQARALDLLALGDDVAGSLGYKPRQITRLVIMLSAVAVGACVSVAGAIGFVGLIAPYLARSLTRGHPGRAMLPAALIGALLMAAADLATRLFVLDHPLPVGVLTAMFGSPLFIWLIVTMRQRVAV